MNIAIFVSGSGSNCENLIRYFTDSESVHCALVVSNKPDHYPQGRPQQSRCHDAPSAEVQHRLHRAGRLPASGARLPHRRLSPSHHQYPPSPPAEVWRQRHVGPSRPRSREGCWRDRDRHDSPLGHPRLRCRRDHRPVPCRPHPR